MNKGKTHWENCWKDRSHHECALNRINELEKALRHISLGSQNSTVYKEDLGKTARKALWLNDTDNPFEKD